MDTPMYSFVPRANGTGYAPPPAPAPRPRSTAHGTGEATPEVFVLDDDESVRTAMGYVLRSAGYQVRTFASSSEFLRSRCYLGRGCLLLDLGLPDLDGGEVFRRLQRTGAVLPVVIVTGYADVPTSVRAIKAGVVDFLVKPVREDVLLQAVDEALAAESRLRAERQRSAGLRARLFALTAREREVLVLVARGRLNKEIAQQLGIAEKTVKVHRGRLMTKMGVRRTAELVQAAAVLGLVCAMPSESSVQGIAARDGREPGIIPRPDQAPDRSFRSRSVR